MQIHRAPNGSVDEWPATANWVRRERRRSDKCKSDYGRKIQGCPCLPANNTLHLMKAIYHIDLLPLPSKAKIILSSHRGGKRSNQRLWIHRIQRYIHQIIEVTLSEGAMGLNNERHKRAQSGEIPHISCWHTNYSFFVWVRGWNCLVSDHFASSCSKLFFAHVHQIKPAPCTSSAVASYSPHRTNKDTKWTHSLLPSYNSTASKRKWYFNF